MRIHKKTSIPREIKDGCKATSINVLIWDGNSYRMAYYFYPSKEWFEVGKLEQIKEDFVWIYPPVGKMKEVFNRIIKK